jgi:hypothetical protein
MLELQNSSEIESLSVMAGHGRLKDGVASARLCPGHPRLILQRHWKDVDARHEAGHDRVEAQRAKAEAIHFSSGRMHCFACASNEKLICRRATK